jgi:two-component system sensor histidine kinase AtoS
MNDETLVSLHKVSLSYGMVQALDQVSFEIKKGEIHALIGEHGAGKSSLAHILSGFLQPKGEIYWKGENISPLSDNKARNLGIRFVTQGVELFNHMPVAYNLFNNNKSVFSHFLFRQKNIYKLSDRYLAQCGCSILSKTLVEHLSLPEKVMIDILRQLYCHPSLLILDEAIEKLTALDLDKVIKLIRELRESGGSVLFITHRIDDVYAFADRVTIVRNGNVLVTESVKNIDKINLIKLAYTHIVRNKVLTGLDKEFYHLLKYNEAILEFLPMTLLVVNRDGKLKLLNHHGETFFKRKRDVILNGSLSNLFGDQNSIVTSEIWGILETQKWENLYHKHIIIDDTKISCNVVIYPIMDGNYYLGSIIIVDDITEQEKLREKIHFSEKLASVGLLAAGVAHEINNPLEIINNYLDVLKGRNIDSSSLTYMNYIEEELDSIEQIVSNLITFSEKNRYHDETLNLAELLKQMVLLIKPNAEKRGIEFSVEISSTDFHIYANRTKMKQVILNIIKNAFDAMPDGGLLTIVQNLDKDFVKITFLDSGSGIGEGNLKNLLLPFYSTKEEHESNMGLGLSIVYGILDSYGGSIEIENRRDRTGCEVTVSLPRFYASTSQQ